MLIAFLVGFLITFAPFLLYVGLRTLFYLWDKRTYRKCRYCKVEW